MPPCFPSTSWARRSVVAQELPPLIRNSPPTPTTSPRASEEAPLHQPKNPFRAPVQRPRNRGILASSDPQDDFFDKAISMAAERGFRARPTSEMAEYFYKPLPLPPSPTTSARKSPVINAAAVPLSPPRDETRALRRKPRSPSPMTSARQSQIIDVAAIPLWPASRDETQALPRKPVPSTSTLPSPARQVRRIPRKLVPVRIPATDESRAHLDKSLPPPPTSMVTDADTQFGAPMVRRNSPESSQSSTPVILQSTMHLYAPVSADENESMGPSSTQSSTQFEQLRDVPHVSSAWAARMRKRDSCLFKWVR